MSSLHDRLLQIDRLQQIVGDIDINRLLQVKTEHEITQGDLSFGTYFKVKFV